MQKAVQRVARGLVVDKGFNMSWQANIAICFQDEVARFKKKHLKKTLSIRDVHHVSNLAAESFINRIIHEGGMG